MEMGDDVEMEDYKKNNWYFIFTYYIKYCTYRLYYFVSFVTSKR